MERRRQLIKKLMTEHGWSMIKASQEIAKQKNIEIIYSNSNNFI